MYEKIMIPTDGSETAEFASEHAIELAKGIGAKVIALYVIDVSAFAGIPTEAVWESMKGILEEEGLKSLETIKKLAKEENVAIETLVLEGSPGDEVVKVAEKMGIDLIIMGTAGRTGIDKFLLGSVSEKVVRHASCPVMVVRK